MDDDDKEIELPAELTSSLRERINEVDTHGRVLNAYVQGIADVLGVPSGWQFDRELLVFTNPSKGNDG